MKTKLEEALESVDMRPTEARPGEVKARKSALPRPIIRLAFGRRWSMATRDTVESHSSKTQNLRFCPWSALGAPALTWVEAHPKIRASHAGRAAVHRRNNFSLPSH
jgi:hypothetical protein